MIETVTYPHFFTEKQEDKLWVNKDHRFYFEFFGETKPAIDMNYAELLPQALSGAAPQNGTHLSAYQYWWTLGRYDNEEETEEKEHWIDHLFSHQEKDEFAVSIYMYYPLDGGWRMKEVAPLIKYLQPLHEQLMSWQSAGEMLGAGAPMVSAAEGLALFPRVIGSVLNPFIGAMSLGIPAIMAMAAKLHANEVPPTDGYKWAVKKITGYHAEFGLLSGVVWKVPKKMFRDLGGRLTGSLVSCFIPYHLQQKEAAGSDHTFLSRPILAKAILHCEGGPDYLPEKEKNDGKEYLQLEVAPYDRNAQPQSAF